VPGELYIGGRRLARGYFDRPELTAERFVPDPFRASPARGSIAPVISVAVRGDGALEFLGRLDLQVKLRGFRIELGEIEHVLTRIPSVKAGVVLLLDGGSAAGPRLVAFVVGRSRTKELVTSELAEEMKRSLPVYMVPSVFVVLDALPLNASGKIDRKALAATDLGDRSGSQATFESPEGDVEAVVSQIWSEVLGVSKVGRHDNFFDLGGHSLLAMQVHSKLIERLGKEFPILNLFSYTTVASLAAYLSGMDSSGTDDSRDTQLERGAARLALRRQRRRRSEG
jgi:acyl carrier protein